MFPTPPPTITIRKVGTWKVAMGLRHSCPINGTNNILKVDSTGPRLFWCLSATGLEVKRSSSRTAMGVHRSHLAFKGPTIISVWDFKRAVDVILDAKWIWGGLRHEMLNSMGPQQTWASLNNRIPSAITKDVWFSRTPSPGRPDFLNG